MTVPIKIQKLDPEARAPKRHGEQDAGIDVYSNESHELAPGETYAFSTGIATEFPTGYVALIWDRGSMGLKGVHTFGGVVDAGYRGEWKILLHNASAMPVQITRGDRIAQALVQRYESVTILEVAELGASERGEGRFGSSGR